MGCSQSKIENEEAVSRCKDRKIFMKDAVSSRNAFASAHSAYAMYLKNTGAALSDFAQGEVQNPLLAHPQANSSTAAVAQSSFEKLTPPPPPPPLPANLPPLQRAVTMPEIKIPKSDTKLMPNPIEEEEDEDEDDVDNEGSLRRRRGSRSGRGGHRETVELVEDDAPPPVPPLPTRTPPPSLHDIVPPPPLQRDTTYDYIFSVEHIPGPTLSEVEEVNVNREEIDRKAFDDRPKRVNDDDDGRMNAKVEAVSVPETAMEPPPPLVPAVPASAAGKSVKKKQVVTNSGDGKRIAKSNVNMLHIFVDLDDHFLKASESAHEVSKMLEATRLHYHSNFADNRGNWSYIYIVISFFNQYQIGKRLEF